jgi:hypothetical protein
MQFSAGNCKIAKNKTCIYFILLDDIRSCWLTLMSLKLTFWFGDINFIKLKEQHIFFCFENENENRTNKSCVPTEPKCFYIKLCIILECNVIIIQEKYNIILLNYFLNSLMILWNRRKPETNAQTLVSFKKYMPHPLPFFKVNISPFPLPHFASIFFAYLWSFRWPNYIVTLPRYFSFRLPHLNIPTSEELDKNIQWTSHFLYFSHWNGYSHFRFALDFSYAFGIL